MTSIAPSYSAWVRDIVALSQTGPGINQLFDSSMEEPTALLRQALQAIDWAPTGHYRSTFPTGNSLVLAHVAQRLRVDVARILATAGATAGAHLVCAALVKPGDHVLIERPYFEMLIDAARSVGAEIDYIDRDPVTGAITAEALAGAIQPSTKLVLLANPNNPTGFVLDREARRALATVAEAHQVPVVFDEVYADFTGDDPAAMLAVHDSPWFISVSSLSKVYGLYALKCGWIVTGDAVHGRILDTYRRLESSVSRSSHAIAARILQNVAPFDAHWREILASSRPIVEQRFQELQAAGLIEVTMPESGCLVFPRLPTGWDDTEFSAFAIEHQAVAVAPGSLFGRPGHLRIGFGRNGDHVREGLDRLATALRAYREIHA